MKMVCFCEKVHFRFLYGAYFKTILLPLPTTIENNQQQPQL